MAIISLESVEKTFTVRHRAGRLRRTRTAVHAVDDVSFSVEAGSMVGYIGPNGAGKTTLLRTASGLLPTDAGRMLMDGVDVTGWRSHRLVDAGICHVPEGRGIFRNLSVRENLVLVAPRSSPDEAVERRVDAFEKLGQRLGQTAGTMSGGEQQMLALARPTSPIPAWCSWTRCRWVSPRWWSTRSSSSSAA